MGGPGPRNDVAVTGYFVRAATREDLPRIEELGMEKYFNVGLENLELYFDTSPTTWFVVVKESTGEIVGYDSYNLMSNGAYMGYQILMTEEERGKGLTRLFNCMNYANFKCMGNATPASILRYKFDVWGPKLMSFYGIIRHARMSIRPLEPPGVQITQLREQDLPEVFAYDFKILGIERNNFLRKWMLPENSNLARFFVVRKDGAVVAVGGVRRFPGYWAISPLYSDSEPMGDLLLRHVILNIEDSAYACIATLARNRAVWVVVKEMGMMTNETEMRCYEKDDTINKRIQWDSIYGIQEFFPI